MLIELQKIKKKKKGITRRDMGRLVNGAGLLVLLCFHVFVVSNVAAREGGMSFGKDEEEKTFIGGGKGFGGGFGKAGGIGKGGGILGGGIGKGGGFGGGIGKGGGFGGGFGGGIGKGFWL